MKLSTLSRYSLAEEMLSLDARICIVSKQTGFSHDVLREMYAEMHDSSPSAGPLKSSSNFFLKSYRLKKESTIYAFFFVLGILLIFTGELLTVIDATFGISAKYRNLPCFLTFRMLGCFQNGWMKV